MPFIDDPDPERERVTGLQPVGAPAGFVATQDPNDVMGPPVPPPTRGETYGAAFRQENTVVNAIDMWSRSTETGPVDPDHNPWDTIAGTDLEPYSDQFLRARNSNETSIIAAKIREEIADRKTLSDAGIEGAFSQLLAGVVDVPTLLPGGGLIRAARGVNAVRRGSVVGRAAADVGLMSGVSAAAAETVLQANQETRSLGESLFAVGGATILGGLLGAGVGELSHARMRALARSIDADGRVPLDSTRDPFGAGGLDAVRGRMGQQGTAGAAAADNLASAPTINRTGGMADALAWTSPYLRTMASDIKAVRNLSSRLFDSVLGTAQNDAFVPTKIGAPPVERRIVLDQARLYRGLVGLDDAYKKYYFGKKDVMAAPTRAAVGRVFNKTKMSAGEFRGEVAKAMRRGDKHDIPEVQEAAQHLRKEVYDPFKKEAQDLGVIPGDAELPANYLHRLYDVEKIKRESTRFTKILTDWLESGQQKVEQEIAELERAIGEAYRRAGLVQPSDMDAAQAAERAGVEAGPEVAAILEQWKFLKETPPKPPQRLVDFLKAKGGLQDYTKTSEARQNLFGGELEALGANEIRGLVKDGGMGLDDAARAAWEAGYIPTPERPTPAEFLEFLDADLRGEFVVRAADQEALETWRIAQGVREELASYGIHEGLAERTVVKRAGEAMFAHQAAGSGAEVRIADEIADAELRLKEIKRSLEAGTLPDPERALVELELLDLEEKLVAERAELAFLKRAFAKDKEATKPAGEPPLASGMVRIYHGGEPQGAGPLWFSTHKDYAQGYADKSGGRVWYVDLPESHPLLDTGIEGQGVRQGFTVNKEFPAEIAGQRKPLVADEAEPERGPVDDFIDENVPPEFADAAHGAAESLGLKPPKDTAEIAELKDKIAQLREFAGLDRGELQRIAEDVKGRIEGTPAGRIVYGANVPDSHGFDLTGPQGPLKERTLKIPDEYIEDFLDSDVERVTSAYVRTMAPDLAIIREFGDLNLTDALKKIEEEANDLKTRVGDGPESKKISDHSNAMQKDLVAVVERMRGIYKQSPVTDRWRSAARIAKKHNVITLLGGMTLGAATDVFRPMMTQGLKAYGDGLVALAANFGSAKLAMSEAKLAGTALDMVLNTRANSMADIMDDFGGKSHLEKGLDYATGKFGLLSLMAPWNTALKQFSGLVAQTKMLKLALKLHGGGELSQKEVRALAGMNLSRSDALAIAAEFKAHGGIEGHVYLPNTDAWGNAAAREKFRAALSAEVDRTIVTPGQDKPLLASTTLGGMAYQFKSFGLASMQRTVMAGVQQRDAGVVMGSLLSVAMGAWVEAMRNYVNGVEQPKTYTQWVERGIDRSGLTGALYDVNHALEMATRGRVGVSAAVAAIDGTKPKPLSRFASRNISDAFLGPTAGRMQDIAGVVGGTFSGEFKDKEFRALRRSIPYQNLFYLSRSLRKLEEQGIDALGLQRTGPRRDN
jgi:peptidyl-tRNA hydrolase